MQQIDTTNTTNSIPLLQSDHSSFPHPFLNNPDITDIINLDSEELLEFIKMTRQQKHEQALLKQHLEKYHIWQNSKGIYLTYLPAPDKPKGRTPVTATTKDGLERKITDFYLKKEREQLEALHDSELCTIRKIYPKWLEFKELETTATSYIHKIDADWRRYYVDDPIIDEDIRTFTKARLKEWALSKIRKNELGKCQYYNMAVIIRQCLGYAVDHEFISTNLYNSFRVDGKLFKKKRKPDDATQVYLINERPLIEAEAWKDFREHGYTTALAIPLAFRTGLRLGELTALKTTDVCRDGKYLHVQRMIQRVDRRLPDGSWTSNEWQVVDHVKTSAGDRYVFLTEEAREIIKLICKKNEEDAVHDDDFLFLKDGKRIKPNAIIVRIRKYCNHISIQNKGMHKIRKSYISALLDAGLNINEVRKQVGHEDERTTLHNYCFNRNEESQNEREIERALAM